MLKLVLGYFFICRARNDNYSSWIHDRPQLESWTQLSALLVPLTLSRLVKKWVCSQKNYADMRYKNNFYNKNF